MRRLRGGSCGPDADDRMSLLLPKMLELVRDTWDGTCDYRVSFFWSIEGKGDPIGKDLIWIRNYSNRQSRPGQSIHYFRVSLNVSFSRSFVVGKEYVQQHTTADTPTSLPKGHIHTNPQKQRP